MPIWTSGQRMTSPIAARAGASIRHGASLFRRMNAPSRGRGPGPPGRPRSSVADLCWTVSAIYLVTPFLRTPCAARCRARVWVSWPARTMLAAGGAPRKPPRAGEPGGIRGGSAGLGAGVQHILQIGVRGAHCGLEVRARLQRLHHVRNDVVLAGVGSAPVLGVEWRDLRVTSGLGESGQQLAARVRRAGQRRGELGEEAL